MKDKIFSDEMIHIVKECVEECKKNADRSKKSADDERADSTIGIAIKAFSLADAHTNVRLQSLFSLTSSMMNAIDSLSNAIDELPSKEEFNTVKKDLKKEVNDKLNPLREEYDQMKEIRRRGEETDAYG